MKILVTGSAGFLGSHLVEHLLTDGHIVYGIDNMLTGQKENINKNHNFCEADITNTSDMQEVFSQMCAGGDVELIYNLACPASPDHYQRHSLKTLDTCYIGLRNILEFFKYKNPIIVHTSTSEVYGNPDHTPQEETYHGSVNSFGPRACYDEGKRVAEALIFEYMRLYKLDIKVARIFNTYGPRMAVNDGRVISNFIWAALNENDLYMYGDGQQSRSFCYVSDTVEGLIRLTKTSPLKSPVNIGNPNEKTIHNIAELVLGLTGSKSNIFQIANKKDDPMQRCPDITRARTLLEWEPQVDLVEGLEKTIGYFRTCLTEKEQT